MEEKDLGSLTEGKKADLIIIALKATSNDQYEPLIRPLLKQDTLILTLQNGLGCGKLPLDNILCASDGF